MPKKSNGLGITAHLDTRQKARFAKLLRGFPKVVQRRAVGQIMRGAMRPAWNTMRREAPNVTGTLRRSIATIVWHRKGQWNARTGPRYKGRKRAVYAHFVELGTKGGERTTSGRFSYPSGRGIIRTKSIMHPGTKGKFFVKRAVDAHATQIQARVAKKMELYLLKYWNAKN